MQSESILDPISGPFEGSSEMPLTHIDSVVQYLSSPRTPRLTDEQESLALGTVRGLVISLAAELPNRSSPLEIWEAWLDNIVPCRPVLASLCLARIEEYRWRRKTVIPTRDAVELPLFSSDRAKADSSQNAFCTSDSSSLTREADDKQRSQHFGSADSNRDHSVRSVRSVRSDNERFDAALLALRLADQRRTGAFDQPLLLAQDIGGPLLLHLLFDITTCDLLLSGDDRLHTQALSDAIIAYRDHDRPASINRTASDYGRLLSGAQTVREAMQDAIARADWCVVISLFGQIQSLSYADSVLMLVGGSYRKIESILFDLGLSHEDIKPLFASLDRVPNRPLISAMPTSPPHKNSSRTLFTDATLGAWVERNVG